MPERRAVRFDIGRGATVAEFTRFLADLEAVYLALYSLPSRRDLRGRRRLYILEYVDLDLADDFFGRNRELSAIMVHPDDQLSIERISIQSPGWTDLTGIGKVLEQIREWLKDRHERKKDVAWRGKSEREQAHWENEILKHQAEREGIGVIRDYADLLEEIGLPPEERQRILWERLGISMTHLGQHQDSGLLGSQTDETDKV